MTEPAARGFLTLAGAAAFSSVSVSTVKRWMRQGLPYHQAQARGRILISPAQITSFLHQRTVRLPSLNDMVEETFADVMSGVREKRTQNGNGNGTRGEEVKAGWPRPVTIGASPAKAKGAANNG